MASPEPMPRPSRLSFSGRSKRDECVDEDDDWVRVANEQAERDSVEEARRAKALKAKVLRSVTSIGDEDEPPPREFLVDALFPKEYISMLFGNGGTGKSYLALLLAFCVVRGAKFFGRTVQKGAVLWLDAENLGKEETQRRAWQVARGTGLRRPPKGLYYSRTQTNPGKAEAVRRINVLVGALDIKLIVLDSLSAASAGLDVNASKDVISLMNGISKWNTTVLVLDHVSKKAAYGEAAATAFGSAFKHNLARSTFGLSASGKTIALEHHKSNFSQKAETIHYVMEFDEAGKTAVRFEETEAPAAIPKAKRRTAKDATLDSLRSIYRSTGKPVSVRALADRLGKQPKTISNYLSALSEWVESTPDGWRPRTSGIESQASGAFPEIPNSLREPGKQGKAAGSLPTSGVEDE